MNIQEESILLPAVFFASTLKLTLYSREFLPKTNLKPKNWNLLPKRPFVVAPNCHHLVANAALNDGRTYRAIQSGRQNMYIHQARKGKQERESPESRVTTVMGSILYQ